jgi:DNA-binding NarL/FixJ family response regulator
VPIKVLLADDKEFMRRAIRTLLEANPEIEVVGEAADFAETNQLSKDLKPHVIVMDLRIADQSKLTPTEVKSLLNSGVSRLLAIAVWRDEDADNLARSYGAITLLDKIDLGHTLLPTIMQLASPNSGD